MARYNHFGKIKYKKIIFGNLGIGEKFRKTFRFRYDIVCIKTGEKSYKEQRSGKIYHYPKMNPYKVEVMSYNEKIELDKVD